VLSLSSSPFVKCYNVFKQDSEDCTVCLAVRDTRREGQLVGGTNKKRMVKGEVDVSEKLQVRP
jgi:hypothetical protein